MAEVMLRVKDEREVSDSWKQGQARIVSLML